MLHFFYLINRQRKVRCSKFYSTFDEEEKRNLENNAMKIVTNRRKDYTHFLEYKNMKLVFRRYASLYFVAGVDANDNEMAYNEVIHLFVECLDEYFGSVCELDLVYQFWKLEMIADEIFLGGEIQETSRSVVVNRLRQLDEEE